MQYNKIVARILQSLSNKVHIVLKAAKVMIEKVHQNNFKLKSSKRYFSKFLDKLSVSYVFGIKTFTFFIAKLKALNFVAKILFDCP